jgi:hypothetical protein
MIINSLEELCKVVTFQGFNEILEKHDALEEALNGAKTWDDLGYDDLDLHVIEPNRNEIYFSNKKSNTSGELDVDMNAGLETSEAPIENVRWLSNPPLGKYKISAVFFGKNTNNVKVPFTVEISYRGNSQQFSGTLNYVGESILVHELNINQ